MMADRKEGLDLCQQKIKVLNIIDRYTDLHVLKNEMQLFSFKTTVPEEPDALNKLNEVYLQDYVRLHSQLTGQKEDESFQSLFIHQLQKITSEASSGNFCDLQMKHLSFLVEKTTGCKEALSEKIKENIHNFKHSLPIIVLFELNRSGLLHLDVFLKENINHNHILREFVYELQYCCLYQEDNRVADIVCGLIKIGYQSSSCDDKAMLKVCQYILQHVFRNTFNKLGEQTSKSLQSDKLQSIFYHLRRSTQCDKSTLRLCHMHQLASFISHNPVIKVSEAVHQQSKWTSCAVSSTLLQAYKQIFLSCDLDDAISILDKVLLKREVNWKSFLTFVSAVISTFKDSAIAFEELIASEVKKGLEGSCTDDLVVGFLMARQCSLEGSHIFMSYTAWFQKYFGSSSHCLTNSSCSFRFLLKFLTSLVPFEPVQCIQVHVSSPPQAPHQNQRESLREYVALARTRINDLKPSRDKEADHSFVTKEVEDFASLYGKCNRIPSAIMEMSIFRKTYYTEKFLPSLLQVRPLPDVADNRMKLIDALLKFGKIPKTLYATYKSKCDAESSKLYEGIIDLVGDFDESEDPVENIKNEVQQYFRQVQSSTDSIAGICDFGQSLNRALHHLLPPTSYYIEDDFSVEIGEEHPKNFDESVKKICEGILSGLSSVTSQSVGYESLVYLIKILGNYRSLKELLCYHIWQEASSNIKDQHYQPNKSLILLLIGTFSNQNWIVKIQSRDVDRENKTSTCHHKTELPLLKAVISSLLYYVDSTSFFNTITFQMTIVEKLIDFSDCDVIPQMSSMLWDIFWSVQFAKSRLESFVKTKHCKGAPAQKRQKLELSDDKLKDAEEFLLDINKVRECFHKLLPCESDNQTKLMEFVKREIYVHPAEDFIAEPCRKFFYKKILFHDELSLISLQNVVEFFLDKFAQCGFSQVVNRQVITFFCDHLKLLLQARGCSSPAEWLMTVLEERVNNVLMKESGTYVLLRREAIIRHEVSSFVQLMILLPPQFLYHHSSSHDGNSSWTQAPCEMEEICQTVNIFLKKFVKDYFSEFWIYDELMSHLLFGLIQSVPEHSVSLFPYLCSNIPLCLVYLLVDWDELPDVQCVCKIRQPGFYETVKDVVLFLNNPSSQSIDTSVLNGDVDSTPLYPICHAFLRVCVDSSEVMATQFVEKLSCVSGDSSVVFVSCLIAFTGSLLETSTDYDLKWPANVLEGLLPDVIASRLFLCLLDENSSWHAMFPTSVCKSYFCIALIRLFSMIKLPLNFLNDENFLSMLLSVYQRVKNYVECSDQKVQFLFIKSARSATTMMLKKEILKSDIEGSFKAILKTELHRRYR